MILVITACSTARVSNTKTNSSEVLVFGKLSISIYDKLADSRISDNLSIHFNKNPKYKYTVNTDSGGFFCIKLPLGRNFIKVIRYTEDGDLFSKSIQDDYIFIDITSSENIYYIGDIVVNWNVTYDDLRDDTPVAAGASAGLVIGSGIGDVVGSEIGYSQNGGRGESAGGAIGSVVGSIAGSVIGAAIGHKKVLKAEVKNHGVKLYTKIEISQETIDLFTKKFPKNSKTITTRPLIVKRNRNI